MENLAVALVVTGAFCQALDQVIQRKLIRDNLLGEYEFLWLHNALSLFVFALAIPVFLIIDGGAFFTYRNIAIFWIGVGVALIFNPMIQVANSHARKLAPLANTAALFGVAPCITALSGLLFNERPSAQGWIGIITVYFGTCWFQNAGGKSVWGLFKPFNVPRLVWKLAGGGGANEDKALGWAWGAAFLSTFGLLSDGLMARGGNVALGGAVQHTAFTLFFWQLMRAEPKPEAPLAKRLKGRWGAVLIAGAAWGLLFILVVAGFRLAPIAYVASLKRPSIGFAMALSYFYLKERKEVKQRLGSSLLIMAGAMILAFDSTAGKTVGKLAEWLEVFLR